MEFKFVLTEQEAQLMLNALTQLPYNVVNDLINKVQGQAIQQRAEQQSHDQMNRNDTK